MKKEGRSDGVRGGEREGGKKSKRTVFPAVSTTPFTPPPTVSNASAPTPVAPCVTPSTRWRASGGRFLVASPLRAFLISEPSLIHSFIHAIATSRPSFLSAVWFQKVCCKNCREWEGRGNIRVSISLRFQVAAIFDARRDIEVDGSVFEHLNHFDSVCMPVLYSFVT